jgi:hypothetical protein
MPARAACSYPAQVLDLSNWKQTLPIGSAKSPTEIKQAILSSFVHDPYFRTASSCDSVVFRAPVNGVTTSGSGYPRSELREMSKSGSSNASWSTTSGVHTMIIDQAITAVPLKKRHVVAGQIHDADDDVIVVRLEYPKLFVDINGATGPTLDANYTLGKRFTVKFEAGGGKIKVFYNGSASPVYTLSKSSSGNYFKAGAYTQSNCTKESVCTASNYGEVAIYKLAVTHQASGATAPTAPTPAPAPAPAALPAPAVVPITGLTFEAEQGAITAPFSAVADAKASGGSYVVQTTDTGTGTASYALTIPVAGEYRLRAKVIAPNGSSNSVQYALDGASATDWSFPDTLTEFTWADGPTVKLSEGAHTLVVSKRETNTRLDQIEFAPVVSEPAVAVVTSDATTPLEAESGVVSGGMKVVDDPAASGGKYVEAVSSGAVTYDVNVPTVGTYRVSGWIKAANASSDSFSLSVDGKSAVTWTLKYPTLSWTNDVDDVHTFSLGAGRHTIALKYREMGAKIDRLQLVRQ